MTDAFDTAQQQTENQLRASSLIISQPGSHEGSMIESLKVYNYQQQTAKNIKYIPVERHPLQQQSLQVNT